MNKIDKKMAVLLAVKDMHDWVSFPELIAYLGEGYAERSVRRWLNALVQAQLIEKTGLKKGTRYRVTQTTANHLPVEQIKFSAQSERAIAVIKRPLFERTPISYQADWLDSYEPNKTFYLNKQQRLHLKAHGTRTYEHDMAGTYARHIYNRLLIDLSYNSSRLEGNTYSLLDTEKLILEGISDDSKLDEEKVMILNHKEAIRYLIDNTEKLIINTETICTLHYLLSDGLLPVGHSGTLRDHAVKIGGSTYLPLNNKKRVADTLNKICKKSTLIDDPYEQSFFLLTHLAYLQAFEDVNKRTSRLSANIPLIYNNLVPLSFNDVSKENYNNAVIAVYELNNTAPLADLYCYSYQRTCTQYDVSIESIGFDKIRITYRQQRRDILHDIITQQLAGHAIQHTIQQMASKTIPEADQKAFIESVNDDLKVLSPSRIAGLGVSLEQLNTWLSLQ